jgi:hypothetical protein
MFDYFSSQDISRFCGSIHSGSEMKPFAAAEATEFLAPPFDFSLIIQLCSRHCWPPRLREPLLSGVCDQALAADRFDVAGR